MAEETNSKAEDNAASITVTSRSDLSPLYKVLRTIIRPFRPRLVSSNKRCPAGSLRLPNRPRTVNKINVIECKVEVPRESVSGHGTEPETKNDILWLYDLQSPSSSEGTGERTHWIYYFSGGGFQSPPSSEHWKFCAHIASSLAPSRGRIALVSYPLAPNSPARDTLPLLRRWLAQELKSVKTGNGIISLAGDSAGANIALSLGLWCADQLALAKSTTDQERVDDLSHLRSVLAISPPTDMRNQNPDISLANARDPVLTKRLTDDAARAWSEGSEMDDPYLSPNLAYLGNVRESSVRVSGVVGTADVLAPNSLVFLEKCKDESVQGSWLVWDGQMHCLPLAACYGLREGRQARAWAERVLREVT